MVLIDSGAEVVVYSGTYDLTGTCTCTCTALIPHVKETYHYGTTNPARGRKLRTMYELGFYGYFRLT